MTKTIHTKEISRGNLRQDHATRQGPCLENRRELFHQPEAWETCDTGWYVIDQTEYYYGVSVIDEQTVRCSVTWDDEAGDYSIEQFEPWYYSMWQHQ